MSPRYFPILKWKQGEQGAVLNLAAADRMHMLPIIEAQPTTRATIGAALKAQLEKTGAALHPLAIDLRAVYPTGVPLQTLARLCIALHGAGLLAYPAINSSDAFLNPAGLAAYRGFPAVVLRLDVRVTPLVNALALIQALRNSVGRRTQIFVVVDLGALGDSLVPNLVTLVEPFVRDITATGAVTRAALAGGSFPFTLQGLPQGAQTRLPRKEWLVWQQLVQRPGCTDVRYGDYTVTNPQPMEIKDPTQINPSAAIRYALRDEWWLLRAGGVRTAGFGQYNTLCQLLIRSPDYAGPAFSYGDERYQFHAGAGARTGNLTTWRRDATNHHLVQTVRQLPPMP
jgi:hypothetical protein